MIYTFDQQAKTNQLFFIADVAQNCSQYIEQPTFDVSSNNYRGHFIPNGVQVTEDVIFLLYAVNDAKFNNSSPVPELLAYIFDTGKQKRILESSIVKVLIAISCSFSNCN